MRHPSIDDSVDPDADGMTRTPRDRVDVQRSARIRSHNLAGVLGIVHRRRAVSRAELTRRTGLNRSTIAALVGDLAARRLVFETDPEADGGVGRPSPIVRPDPRTAVIALNPEIDAIDAAVVTLGGTVVDRRRLALNESPKAETAVQLMRDAVADLVGSGAGRHRVIGLGVAVPGLVETTRGIVRLAPHLGWTDQPLGEMLARATGLPVQVANDASLGADAERIFGAGVGVADLVYLNGGASGIGGGIIAGGVPLRGFQGFAGEIGHTLVSATDARDPSGSQGSLEVEVSRARLIAELGVGELDSDRLERTLVESTSPGIIAEIRRQLEYLSIAIGAVVNLVNPELVVLGGFLASLDRAAPGVLEPLVRARSLPATHSGWRVVQASLGSSLLLIGAAELAFADVLADPTRMSVASTAP